MDQDSGFTTRVWLNTDHAAKYLRLDRRLIADACTRGELRHVFVSRHQEIRIRLDWLEAWRETAIGAGPIAPGMLGGAAAIGIAGWDDDDPDGDDAA